VFRVFCLVFVVPLGRFRPQLECMLKLLRTLDLLQALNRGRDASPNTLGAALRAHLASYSLAYGFGYVPKHHMAMHLSSMLAQFGRLISLFTHERKHKHVKRYIQDRRKLAGYEKGLIAELTCEHLRALETPLVKAGMECTRAARGRTLEAIRELRPGARDVVIGRVVGCSGETITAGDVILVRYNDRLRVAETWFHCSIDGGDTMTCASLWVDVHTSGDGCTRTVRKAEDPMLFPTSDAVAALVFRESNDRVSVTVVLPPF
jgi:hypothetical protein